MAKVFEIVKKEPIISTNPDGSLAQQSWSAVVYVVDSVDRDISREVFSSYRSPSEQFVDDWVTEQRAVYTTAKYIDDND